MNSNTDRCVKAILEASRLESEFVKLSHITVRPCLACKKCASDNFCKQADDFPELAEKIKNAKALVIGSYTPYGEIDAFTKALFERLWSLRHVHHFLEHKVCATVTTSLRGKIVDRISEVYTLFGKLSIQGNQPCFTCGEGDSCKMSGYRYAPPDVCAANWKYNKVEDQPVWQEALQLGKKIGELVRASASPASRLR
jgi:hypothetical protein